jgi:diphosphomevalonate decarboxylase
MGKLEHNIPNNASLSYTLDKFTSEVSLEICDNADVFINEMEFDQQSIDRFLNHLRYIKGLMHCKKFFKIKSRNNFPHSVGIASSASSFAALTICSFKAICEIENIELPPIEEMSKISRRASGSSCRSFFSPWSIWRGESAEKIDIKINELTHNLVLVNKKLKEVSSSEAHGRVQSSLLFDGRARRAEMRMKKLIDALNEHNWSIAYQLCWEEFWDMHALFETSAPHFGYIDAGTISVLSEIRKFWKIHNDGPIATVDAGCNVHLLWRKDQTPNKFFESIKDSSQTRFFSGIL